jgi:phosphotransferase system enzyme I (PtsI)
MLILRETEIPADLESIQPERVEQELEKTLQRVGKIIEQLEGIYGKRFRKRETEEAEIFVAHRMILEDPVFPGGDGDRHKDGLLTASTPLQRRGSRSWLQCLEPSDDAYLREESRRHRDIGEASALQCAVIEIKDVSSLKEVMLYWRVHDITPSLMATIEPGACEGILAEVGGATAHTAIWAETWRSRCPRRFGHLSMIKDGEMLILGRRQGRSEISPAKQGLRRPMKK